MQTQFSMRLPTLRFHLASLSRFPLIRNITILNNTHSRNSQMEGENNSSMEIDVAQLETSATNGAAAALEQCDWRCQPIEAVQRGLQPYELEHLGAVQHSGHHRVMYRHNPIRETPQEPPRPYRGQHKWDAEHVRLPCAVESKYPVEAADGTSQIESRWGMIERALLQPINNSKELQAAILSYNTTYRGQWSFRALHKLFNEELDESETCVFFEDLLPRISRLALRLPELIQAPIPLLKQHHASALSLSQEQISCLLANAFLCTYPRRNTLKRKSEYSNFPDINFNRLYQSTGASVLEKLKCIFHYFRRVCPTERDASNVPAGCVSFVRCSEKPEEQVKWNESKAKMSSIPMHINASGTIEDEGIGLLQVDFANKFLGGGVLGQGCVQEEIRFVICPEFFVSKLFTECLLPSEALLIVGCERYSNYTGYASSFVWAGNHEDHTPRDSSRRRRTAIVAIDALSFGKSLPMHQYREDLILRELNKASVGFKYTLATPAPGVATGNWGCGAFGGDPHLKALIQMMVCTHHNRPLAYFTFGNCQLRDDLHRLWQQFRAHGTTVQQLWSVLRRYKKESANQTIYEFVLKQLKPKETPKHVQQQKSPELFMDSSESSLNNSQNDDNDNDVDIELRDDVDDDDDEDQAQTNAMMLAATLDSTAGSSNSSSSNISNSNNTAATVAVAKHSSSAHVAGTRQLSLLDMLDRHYDQGQANGSKRLRPSTNVDKGGKARKDCQDGDVSSGSGNH